MRGTHMRRRSRLRRFFKRAGLVVCVLFVVAWGGERAGQKPAGILVREADGARLTGWTSQAGRIHSGVRDSHLQWSRLLT